MLLAHLKAHRPEALPGNLSLANGMTYKGRCWTVRAATRPPTRTSGLRKRLRDMPRHDHMVDCRVPASTAEFHRVRPVPPRAAQPQGALRNDVQADSGCQECGT